MNEDIELNHLLDTLKTENKPIDSALNIIHISPNGLETIRKLFIWSQIAVPNESRLFRLHMCDWCPKLQTNALMLFSILHKQIGTDRVKRLLDQWKELQQREFGATVYNQCLYFLSPSYFQEFTPHFKTIEKESNNKERCFMKMKDTWGTLLNQEIRRKIVEDKSNMQQQELEQPPITANENSKGTKRKMAVPDQSTKPNVRKKFKKSNKQSLGLVYPTPVTPSEPHINSTPLLSHDQLEPTGNAEQGFYATISSQNESAIQPIIEDQKLSEVLLKTIKDAEAEGNIDSLIDIMRSNERDFGAICDQIGFINWEESDLVDFAKSFLDPSVSYVKAQILVKAMLLERFLKLEKPITRVLFPIFEWISTNHEKALLFGLLIPGIERSSRFQRFQVDAIKRITEQCFSLQLRELFVSELFRLDKVCSESKLESKDSDCYSFNDHVQTIIINIMKNKVKISKDTAELIMEALIRHHREFIDSAKFTTMAVTIVNWHGYAFPSHVGALTEIAKKLTGSMAQALVQKVSQLKSE